MRASDASTGARVELFFYVPCPAAPASILMAYRCTSSNAGTAACHTPILYICRLGRDAKERQVVYRGLFRAQVDHRISLWAMHGFMPRLRQRWTNGRSRIRDAGRVSGRTTPPRMTHARESWRYESTLGIGYSSLAALVSHRHPCQIDAIGESDSSRSVSPTPRQMNRSNRPVSVVRHLRGSTGQVSE
jgi:hypothetical protein